jgi:Methylamine utilisation protein MauE
VNVASTARLDLLTPTFFAVASLLIVSGVAKLKTPGPARAALGVLHLPSRPSIVRGVGLVEIGIGMWCLFGPSATSALLLALLYAAFAGFIAVLMRSANRVTSCGCVGGRDSPPSLVHFVVNTVAAAIAAVLATAPPAGVLATAARLPVGGVPFLVGTGLIAYLAHLTVTYLPAVFWSYGGSTSGRFSGGAPRRFALRPGKAP